MIIKKIQIQNYRSCLDTTFELDPHLSILIGPNGSGKTNILNAILLIKKLVNEDYSYRSLYEDEKPTGQCKMKVWFETDNKKIILTCIINAYSDEENQDIIISSEQQWYLKDFTGSGKRVYFPLMHARDMTRDSERNLPREFYLYTRRRFTNARKIDIPDIKIIKLLGKVADYVEDMKYYSASQFTNPSNCPVSFEIEKEGMRRRGLRLYGHSKFLYDLYKEHKSAKRSRYKQFYDIIGPLGIGLIDAIDFLEIPTSSIDYSVRSGGRIRKRKREKVLIIPKFKIDAHDLSPNQLSEGTFKTITLLFYLITETSSVLLVEEPEVCVHHGLLSSIINLIKEYSYDKQIVVSTHSDFVLDKVMPENVYKVSRTIEKGTEIIHIVKAISRKEYAALRHFLNNEGNLGEYWKHGALE